MFGFWGKPAFAVMAVVGILGTVASLACRQETPRMRPFPKRVLWAWESPQDLRFLHEGEGVAFLAGELTLTGAESRWQPRRNVLRVNPGTPLMAVLRVESRSAELTPEQGQALVARGLEILKLPGVSALQVDFDARASERSFYGRALQDLRGRMPEAMPLSITALTSWCLEDRWMAAMGLGRVVDETVPMLFRMGAEGALVRKHLDQGGAWTEPLAAFSYGLSTDEAFPRLRGGRRCYVFHPGPWTAQAWDRIKGRLS